MSISKVAPDTAVAARNVAEASEYGICGSAYAPDPIAAEKVRSPALLLCLAYWTMDPYLVDLIDRMLDKSDHRMEPGHSSRDTISWKANREAEQLDRKEYVSDLLAYIHHEEKRERRDRAYFILSHLAKNSSEDSVVQHLVNRIAREKNKYVISSLLDCIARLDKPAGTDLGPIFDSMLSKEWLIRHSAIGALALSKEPLAEDRLIEVLETSDNPHDVTHANAMLNRIGTPKSIPHLEKYVTSRKRDVKISAKLAIEEIKKRNQ